MNVLLIKAPYRDVYGPIKMAAGNYFLLGLGYIAAYLRQNGHSVAILDPEAQGLSDDVLVEKIKKYKPRIVGLSATTPDFANALKIAELVKKHTDAFVLLGGIHASSLPEYTMRVYADKFDAVCIGEGELTMLEVCKFLEGGIKSLFQVKGICFNDGAKLVRTEPRLFIEDLDSLPYPARDLVDLGLYRPHAFNFRKGKTATIITSRGCPFRCIFCASKLSLGGSFRARSPDSVLKEMHHLQEKYGINHILIQDDTFTFDVERAKEICRRIIKSGLKIEWFAFSQVTKVDEELFYLMKKAGCYCVGFGIESADVEVLRRMRKANTIEQCEFAVHAAKKNGLKTQCFFVFGSDGDTQETAEKTIEFARRLSPTLAFFNKLVAYPGTEIFVKHFGDDLNKLDWKDFVPMGVTATLHNTSLNKAQLQRIVYIANLKFYFRPSQLWEILKYIRSPYELKAYIVGGVGLILQMLKWKKSGRGK